MGATGFAAVLAAWLCCALAAPAAARAAVTAQQLDATVARLAGEIKQLQKADGSWSGGDGQGAGRWPLGYAGLGVLALSSAGLPADDPAIAKGVAFLASRKAESVYEASVQIMALESVDRERYAAQIKAAADYLMRAQQGSGGWSYYDSGARPDNSNSQFAVLGLHSAARSGVSVPDAVWRKARDYFAGMQTRDGGWDYAAPTDNPRGSMTAAGLASLHICNLWLHSSSGTCGRYDEGYEARIEAGIAWLVNHFTVEQNPGAPGWKFYYLYALERAGVVSARRYMGEHDWYLEGVNHLVGDPSALEDARLTDGEPLVRKTFALLFLARGNAPVLIHKAQWTGTWNPFRYDVEFLVQYVERQLGQGPTWQIMPLEAPLDHLLAAPILYISGRGAVTWSSVEIQHLKQYIESGGFVFVEANGGDAAFDSSFRKIIADHFPGEELTPVPGDHPVYTSYFGDLPAEARLPMEAITGPCWMSLLYCPGGISCPWDVADYSHTNFKLGMNIIAYVTGLERLEGKLAAQSRPVPEPAAPERLQGAFVVGQMVHEGNWQPHGGAEWRRVLAKLQAEVGVSLFSEPIALDPERDSLFSAHLLSIIGTKAFDLSPEARQKLKTYLERGGFVFAEAACGSEEFDRSFRALVEELFPGQRLEEIPQGHPLYSLGRPLDKVNYSLSVRKASPELSRPALEYVELEGRAVVVYSRYDLSSAIAGHPCHACRAVLEPSASELVLKVLLYSLSR